MLKRTPLYAVHQQLGARLVEFGGWEMPVQYSGIVDEHLAVRQAAGLFDISHMGEVLISGPKAASFLNYVLTNDIRRLEVGQAQYTLMCNVRGGVIDDLYAYRLRLDEYLVVINASRSPTDVAWLQEQYAAHAAAPGPDGNRLEDVSDQLGALAVQGPRVADFIDQCFPGGSLGGAEVASVNSLKKNQAGVFRWVDGREVVIVARTGYTGEDGFEVITDVRVLVGVWNRVLEMGRPYGLKPAGLGARDTLRTEMGYPLYGHELDENTSPLEAGLGTFVRLDKGHFVGRPALLAQKTAGLARRCVAFRMLEKSAPPRPHCPIWSPGPDAVQVGEVASGTQSPSLGLGIGMGYVPIPFAQPGQALEIEIRGNRSACVVVPKPIYHKPA